VEAFLAVLKSVTKEEPVQYVLALLLQMLQGKECPTRTLEGQQQQLVLMGCCVPTLQSRQPVHAFSTRLIKPAVHLTHSLSSPGEAGHAAQDSQDAVTSI
jgi:hypothetical protein